MKKTINLKYWPGFLSAYILLFFPFSYLMRLNELNIGFLKVVLPIIYFLGIIIILFAFSMSNRNLLNKISNLNFFYVYLFFLASVLILTSFFFIVIQTYFFKVLFFVLLFTIYFLWIIIILFAFSMSNRNLLNKISNLNFFYVYLFFLASVLILTSFFSIEIHTTFFKVLFSVLSLGITFTVFYIIQYIYLEREHWHRFFEISSLLFLVLIIIGQLTITNWNAGVGGIRFSGGTNPNTIAYFVLYLLIQTHINALILKKWTKLQKLIWLLSFIVILWTFSRSTLLILFIIYSLYYFYKLFIRVSKELKDGVNIQRKAAFIFRFVGVSLIIYFIYINLFKFEKYTLIEQRLFNITNVSSRSIAWNVLLDYFNKNPVLGGIGWWESSYILASDNIETMANSPHNLFVRLLGETGILGLITILILPAIICMFLIFNNASIAKQFNSYIGFYLFSVIIAIFIAQLLEDKYLVGVFDISNNIIIWFMSFSLIVYHQSKNKKVEIT